MKVNNGMKKFLILVLIIYALGGISFAEEDITNEIDLNSPALKINTQTREDMLNPKTRNVSAIKQTKNNTPTITQYNPDNAYSKNSTTFKKEKKFKNVDIGAQYDTTFTPENASQTRSLYTKMHLNDKASINTSYSTNTNSHNYSANQMNGTVSVAPEYRFNKHLSVQNKYSRNTSNGMSKEEVDIKINPFKDTDRMDLNVGVGEVQYTTGSPSSSQINFGTNFKF